MGGRLDATNTLEPLVTGITPISLDHTDRLGKTVEAIAKEKCGIIKENSIVVSAEQEPAALNCIKKVAAEKHSRLYLVGKDISYETLTSSPEEQTFNVRGMHGEYALLTTPLLGKHQAGNAAAAIGIIESLKAYDIVICPHNITGGIRNVNWPGRMQVISKAPWIVLDGAQNEASAKALKDAVRSVFTYKKLYLVFGVSSGKDIKGISRHLFPLAEKIYFTRADSPRAVSPEKIRNDFPEYGKRSAATFNVKEAVELARRQAGPEDMILVTGSLFVVGEAVKCCAKIR
jgi:dihydrofolate synthase/folylpolyglutamate synthase